MIKGKIKDKKKQKKNKKITSFFKIKRPLNIILLQLIFTIVFFFIIVGNIEPKKVNVRIGDIAPYEIRATRDIEDKEETEKLKNEAMERVEPRFRVDPSVQMEMKNDIRVFFGMVKDVKSYDNLSFSKKTTQLKEQSNIQLPEKHYNTCIKIDNKQLNSLENAIYDITNQIMSAGIKEEELEYELENVASIYESIDMGKDERELGLALIEATIKPNKFLDLEVTQRKKMEEAEKIEQIGRAHV